MSSERDRNRSRRFLGNEMGFQESFNTRVIPAGDRAFGKLVTFRRGGLESEPFTAQTEHREYDVVDAKGFLIRVVSRDFMFPVAAIVLAGETVEPRSGDVLVAGDDEFELLPLGTTPAVELMSGDFRYRVHTKKVT